MSSINHTSLCIISLQRFELSQKLTHCFHFDCPVHVQSHLPLQLYLCTCFWLDILVLIALKIFLFKVVVSDFPLFTLAVADSAIYGNVF